MMDHALKKHSTYSSKHFLPQVAQAFRDGDIWVKLSALICGSSCFARKQYIKGFLITLCRPCCSGPFPACSGPT